MSGNRNASKYPEQLRKFVDRIESEARSKGRDAATARIYGAWSACYVRYCTLNDRSWKDPSNVTTFLTYLRDRSDVDEQTQGRARSGLKFVFGTLLRKDLSSFEWASEQTRRSAPATLPGYDTSQTSSTAPESSGTTPRTQDRASKGGRAEEANVSGDGASRDVNDARPSEQSSLLTRLLFHTSLPIQEALNLCAGDVDLDAGLIYISDAMGTPKRIVEIPDVLKDPLADHLSEIRAENGPSYVDAPLFQANALPGHGETSGSDKSTPATVAESSEISEDSRESLWSYTA